MRILARASALPWLLCVLAACNALATPEASGRIPTVTPARPPAPLASATPDAPLPADPEARLTRYFVNGGDYPLALCNDGSTPAFYLARGADTGHRKWMILLEGDGFCVDISSCAGRNRDEITSQTAPPIADGAGIASADPAQNPDFWSWNRAVLIYCTSDLWTGARLERDADTSFYFRGHYAVNAFIGTLMDERVVGAPSLRAATDVLLAGTGAGGEGLLHNLNRLAPMLAPARASAVVDGATAPWVSPFLMQEQEERLSAAVRRWNPRLDQSCVGANASRETCLGTLHLIRAGYLLPPLFVRQDQLDAHALINQMITGSSEGQQKMVREFAEIVRSVAERQGGAYAPASRIGVTLTNAEFNRQKLDGVTFAQALGNWYFNRAGPKRLIAPP